MESGLEDVWEARRSERFRSDMAVQALLLGISYDSAKSVLWPLCGKEGLELRIQHRSPTDSY